MVSGDAGDEGVPPNVMQAVEIHGLLKSGLITLSLVELESMPRQVVSDLRMIRTLNNEVAVGRDELRRRR